MKIYISQLILIFTSGLIFGQVSIIKSKWILGIEDTTNLEKRVNSGVPRLFHVDNLSNIILCSNTFRGYQVASINSISGKVNWQTARNLNKQAYTFTNIAGVTVTGGYEPTDLSITSNGALELLGKLKNASSGGWAYKLNIDPKTGKEFNFVCNTTFGFLNITNIGNTIKRVLPLDDGTKNTFYVTSAENSDNSTHTMLVDSNLFVRDTLITIPKFLDVAIGNQVRMTNAKKIGNTFYYISYYLNPFDFNNDTLAVQFVFYKYKKNKVLIQKSVSSYISNTYIVNVMNPVNDAFLMAGRIGQAYTALNNSDKNIIDANFVAKIDTNGNLLWRTLLDYSDATRYYFRGPVERKDGKGYWLLARDEFSQRPFCIFSISLDGKIGKRIDLDIGILNEKIEPTNLWEMPNGDLLGSYNIADCTDANADKTYLCNGVFLIEKSKLDLTTLATVATELEATACVVSPNPASQEVTLRFQTPQSGVLSILNIQGQSVGEVRRYDLCAQWQVPLPTLTSGIYFLQLHFQDGTVRTEKVVVAQ